MNPSLRPSTPHSLRLSTVYSLNAGSCTSQTVRNKIYGRLWTPLYDHLHPTLYDYPQSIVLMPDPLLVRPYETKGAFVWDYSIYSYSGVGTTEHTEYQFPEEKTDKILRRWDRGNLGTPSYRQKTDENCQKNTITGYSVYSEQTAIPSIPESEP